MIYDLWLLLTNVAFIAAERLRPWRKNQPARRSGLARDAGFVLLNGYLFGLLAVGSSGWLALRTTAALQSRGWALPRSPIAGWPLAGQIAALFLLSDFLQWCIHNLLHRVPWLWRFHKVHHAIDTMDWLGQWRFHWMESVVYRTLQWLPLAWLGAAPHAVLAVAAVNAAWGEFNHANLDFGLGPLGYVFNSPRMHLWHHDASAEGGVAKNFGTTLALWDFLFGTAFWPRDRTPARLGYPGDEEMPATLAGELAWPLVRDRSAPR